MKRFCASMSFGMHRSRTLILLFAIAICLTVLLFPARGWTQSKQQDSSLRIVTSFAVLADIAKEVGGGFVDVQTLIGPGIDNRAYVPTELDKNIVSDADLIVINGLDYDAWMHQLVEDSGSKATVVVASLGVKPRITEDGLPDPYAWMAPANGKIYARNISEILEDIAYESGAPERAQSIRLNTSHYIQKIDKTSDDMKAVLANLSGDKRFVAIGDNAFGYLASACDLTVLTPSIPNAVAAIKKMGIRRIMLDAAQDPRPAMLLAADSGAKLGNALYATLSPPGGPAPDYLTMLKYNAAELAKSLAENGR